MRVLPLGFGDDGRSGTCVLTPGAVALDGPRTLVLLFGGSAVLDDRRVVDHVLRSFGRSVVVGCSTAGHFVGTEIADENLRGVVAEFADTDIRAVATTVAADDGNTTGDGSCDGSFAAGQRLALSLDHDQLAGVLLLTDGLTVNGSQLVAGMTAALPPDVPVSGGMAGDGERFERTWVLAEGELRRSSAVAVGLYGSAVRLGHGSQGGWEAFGPERRVTRSRGSTVFEIDGRPALALYKDYLGAYATGLPASALLFPLTVRAGEDGRSLVRTVLSIDEPEQSMTFAGDVPEGWTAQLMRSTGDDLIDGAASAAMETRGGVDGELGTGSLAFAVSCVGRRLVLGERTEEELEAITDEFVDGTVLAGFYSYGEVSPTLGGCDLHNQTMTVTLITESNVVCSNGADPLNVCRNNVCHNTPAGDPSPGS